MADNYLEKRYEETLGSAKPKVRRVGHPLDDLLLRNRSYRGYVRDFVVSEEMLRRIVAVNARIPSARNQQALRFRMVTKQTGAEKVLPLIKLGGALPELHLPLPGTEPEAFIVICTEAPDNNFVYIDLGISLQSMLLKAVEMGLGGIVIGAFDHEALTRELGLPMRPLAVLAIGKPAEKIELAPIRAEESHKYYRRDGIHYVPKVMPDDLLI